MPVKVDNDFFLLTLIAHTERVIGGLLLIAGFFLTFRTATTSWDIPSSWFESIGTALAGLATYAFGELILLFSQIEKNTRCTEKLTRHETQG
jgi:hypothetical protein